MLGRTHPPSHPARARLRRAAVAVVAAGAVTALAGPASADAATAKLENIFENGQFAGERLVYEASPGENNSLVITESFDSLGGLKLRLDDTVPITDHDCLRPNPADTTLVDCHVRGLDELLVRLADGKNVLRALSGSVPMLATGEGASTNDFNGFAGEDNLIGSLGNDILVGGAGDDKLNGLHGNDSLAGGSGHDALDGHVGNDRLVGNAGADRFNGSLGIDTVSYSERTNPVKVTIDQLPNDGEFEGDNVMPDVENVEGGAGNDEIIDQVGGANLFRGLGGHDRLHGGAANDILVGGGDDDLIDGGAGIDELYGDTGFDILDGGSENDIVAGGDHDDGLIGGTGGDDMIGGAGTDFASYRDRTQRVTVDLDSQVGDDGASGEGDTVRTDVETIIGGAASDTLTGSAGANKIAGGDGNDVIDGGLGTDSLFGENDNDTIRSKDGEADKANCGADSDQIDADQIDIQTDCEAKAAPAVGIAPKRARIDKQGRVKLTLHCWATAIKRCTGTLTLKQRAGTIASRRFTVSSGDTATVRVRLDRSARKAMAGKTKLRVRAVTRSRDAAGHKWTSTRTLTLMR